MEYADGGEDEDQPTGPLLPQEDRVWRHPSEIGKRVLHSTRARAGLDRRLVVVGTLSGTIGALLAVAILAASGVLRAREVVTERAIERQRDFTVPVAIGDTATWDADIVSIAKDVRPAIVQVVVGDGSLAGSGVIYRSDGLVLTNHHVVESGEPVEVLLHDGRSAPADVLGSDTVTDIAVLRITGEAPTDGYPVALLGTSSQLEVGQLAVAIGSPLGLSGGPSVTVGVVSALGREVQRGRIRLVDMIQFDAPIAPGSSGGALIDQNGALIGITTAIAVSDFGAEGLGFATPIDIAHMVADQIVSEGKVLHAWLGVEGEDLDIHTANLLALKGGALVRGVRGGSPAEVAGVRAADVIVAVDGELITTMGALMVELRSHRPGDVVELRVVRQGTVRHMKAILREAPRS